MAPLSVSVHWKLVWSGTQCSQPSFGPGLSHPSNRTQCSLLGAHVISVHRALRSHRALQSASDTPVPRSYSRLALTVPSGLVPQSGLPRASFHSIRVPLADGDGDASVRTAYWPWAHWLVSHVGDGGGGGGDGGDGGGGEGEQSLFFSPFKPAKSQLRPDMA